LLPPVCLSALPTLLSASGAKAALLTSDCTLQIYDFSSELPKLVLRASCLPVLSHLASKERPLVQLLALSAAGMPILQLVTGQTVIFEPVVQGWIDLTEFSNELLLNRAALSNNTQPLHTLAELEHSMSCALILNNSGAFIQSLNDYVFALVKMSHPGSVHSVPHEQGAPNRYTHCSMSVVAKHRLTELVNGLMDKEQSHHSDSQLQSPYSTLKLDKRSILSDILPKLSRSSTLSDLILTISEHLNEQAI